MLQRSKKPIVLAVNKMDSTGPADPEFYEFYNLGLGDPIAVSAVHGHGTGDLLDACFQYFPPEDEEEEEDDDVIKVAVIGKPNVGKSSLVNRILGEERVIVSNVAGTTRDTVEEKLALVRAAIETEEQSAVLDVIRKTVPTFRDPEEVNRQAAQAQEVRQAAAVDS